MLRNTTSVIYFSFCYHSLNCIILLAISNVLKPPQQINVCSFCACSKFRLIYLFYCSLKTQTQLIALAGLSSQTLYWFYLSHKKYICSPFTLVLTLFTSQFWFMPVQRFSAAHLPHCFNCTIIHKICFVRKFNSFYNVARFLFEAVLKVSYLKICMLRFASCTTICVQLFTSLKQIWI